MGRVSNIKIVFGNHNRSVFKPGQSLTGYVVLKISKPTKVTAVIAKIHGFCKTKWSVGSDDKKQYKEKEQYTLQELALWGGVSNQTTVLQPGEQRKEFSFPLPTGCPSSFTGKHGHVSYSFTVICKFSGGLSLNQDISRPFRVYDMVDLTQNPLTAELFYKPLHVKGRGQDDCCLCLYKVNAIVDITLDKSAYVPGDRILINGHIENGSQNTFLPFGMTLCQKITFYGRRSGFSFTSSGSLKSVEKTVEVCSWRGHPIANRTRKTFQNEATLTIPTVVATGLRNCKFIDVSYFLKFKVTMKGFGSVDVMLRPVNIVIGHRSLPSYDSMLSQSIPSSSTVPSAPQLGESFLPPYHPPPCPEGGDMFGVNLQDLNAPPPSYIEATSSPPDHSSDPPDDASSVQQYQPETPSGHEMSRV